MTAREGQGVEVWSPARAALVVAIASICFATSGPLARVAAPAHPLAIAAGRTSIAAVILFMLAPLACLRGVAALTMKQRGLVTLAGLLLAAHFGFFLAGIARTSLPAAVTLVALEPAAVVLVAWAAFGLRPGRGEGLGVALATAGALVVGLGAGGSGGQHTLLGDGLVLIAVVLYGLYIAFARGLSGVMAPQAYAASVYAAASVGLVCAAAVAGADVPSGTRSIAAIVALGVVPTLGGHTLVQWASGHVPPSIVSLVPPGETLGGIAIAAAFLGEKPGPVEGAGALLTLSGVLVTIAAQGRRRGS